MRIMLTKTEYINKLFVHAMYYWFIGDKFNSRNALAAAIDLTKDLDKNKVKVSPLEFPAKRAAST